PHPAHRRPRRVDAGARRGGCGGSAQPVAVPPQPRGVLERRRQDLLHAERRDRPRHQREGVTMPDHDDEAVEMACAWSDYRKEYGVSSDDKVRSKEYAAFTEGWKAGRHGDQSSVLRDRKST